MPVTASDINALSQLTALLAQAELVLGLPLEPTVEPAPVFTP